MRYALIQNSIVVNVVEWDGDGELFNDYECLNVEDVVCGPGWSYSGGEFTAPPEYIIEQEDQAS